MTDTLATESQPRTPLKVDPETLSLRKSPPRAIRFRRGTIVGGAALGTASLMIIAWVASKPQVFRRVAQQSELSQPMAKPAADALSELPANYDEAPKLGPPLPGDLGRPILRAQQNVGEGTSTRIDDAAQGARQRQLSELKAARESGILAPLVTGRRPADPSETLSPVASAAAFGPAPPLRARNNSPRPGVRAKSPPRAA